MADKPTLNYTQIPGSREKDTEGTFRDTPGITYMTATNMGHATSPNSKHEPGHGRKEGESKKDYGTRVYEAAMERERKRKEAAKKGTNKKSGRAGDFSFGPIRGNVNRYGEGG